MTLDMIVRKEDFVKIGYKRSQAPPVGEYDIYSKEGKVVFVRCYFDPQKNCEMYDVRVKNPTLNGNKK